MTADEILRIKKRPFSGVRPNVRGLRASVRCVGFDIETVRAVPYLLGVDWEGGSLYESTRRGKGLPLLLDTLCRVDDAHDRRATVAGAHNMRFDLGTLLFDWLRAHGGSWKDLPNPEQVDIQTAWGRFELRVGRVCFATLKRPNHRVIHFVDTFAYLKMSLDAAAEALGIVERKMAKPRKLGVHKYSKRHMRRYVQQDARLVRLVLETIVGWWKRFEIRPAVSAPQMAARVFCHKYVRKPWVTVPVDVEQTALSAYHGGKNGFYCEAGWYRRLWSYDLRSAYPWAMSQMPPMTKGEWQWEIDREPRPETWGFVLFRGRLPQVGPYPILYSPGFKPLGPGNYVESLAVTSHEYRLLQRLAPSWAPDAVATVTWQHDSAESRDLRAFADAMVSERNANKDNPALDKLYKLLGNSLYGKFIARTPAKSDVLVSESKAEKYTGQIFYAPIASWITGLVRARITELEYRYQALHTSTDGFLTAAPIPESSPDLGPALGQLKFVHAGPCLLLRNKLYVHFDDAGKVVTAALHGYQGTVADLLTMLGSGTRTYRRSRLAGWRESFRADALPFSPLTRPMMVNAEALERLRKEGRENPFALEFAV